MGSKVYVRDFVLDKFDEIDTTMALGATISDGRVSQNIHRTTRRQAASRTYSASLPWITRRRCGSTSTTCKRDGLRRFARCRSPTTRAASHVSRGNWLVSAFTFSRKFAPARTCGPKRSPTIQDIYAEAASILKSLQLDMKAPEDVFIPPKDLKTLTELPVSSQKLLSRAVLQKKFEEVLGKEDFHRRFIDTPKPPRKAFQFDTSDWTILFSRRRLLAIQSP